MALIPLLLLGVAACSRIIPFGMSNQQVAEALADIPHQFHVEKTAKIGLVTVGNPHNPPVVFIHGSPGTLDNWLAILEDRTFAKGIYAILVDRPGFGRSTPGIHEPSLQEQARRIRTAVTPHLNERKAIWVGHSFGGPVIARMAIDAPELCAGLVFAAASVDPDLEIVRWYQYAADWFIVSWILPPALRTANREILPLKPELEAMLPGWPAISAPIAIVHGTEDSLVPVGNAEFISLQAPHAQSMIIDGEGHFLPWRQEQALRRAIQDLVINHDATP